MNKGDVVAILGPSGSGKTTLLRCMNFLETADGGELNFDGERFLLGHVSKKDAARLRKKTAFVFQNYNLFRNKTALENVTEGLIIGRKMPKAEAIQIGRQALEKVGLSDREDYYLDPELTGEVLAVMRTLAEEGITMLVVTHEMGFAQNVSNQVVFMEHGVVVESGDSYSFFHSPREGRTRSFLQTLSGQIDLAC